MRKERYLKAQHSWQRPIDELAPRPFRWSHWQLLSENCDRETFGTPLAHLWQTEDQATVGVAEEHFSRSTSL